MVFAFWLLCLLFGGYLLFRTGYYLLYEGNEDTTDTVMGILAIITGFFCIFMFVMSLIEWFIHGQ